MAKVLPQLARQRASTLSEMAIQSRFSLIDGTSEPQAIPASPVPKTYLQPVTEKRVVERLGVDGVEEVLQFVVVGFREVATTEENI